MSEGGGLRIRKKLFVTNRLLERNIPESLMPDWGDEDLEGNECLYLL